jgi:hypothetical protein
MFTVDLQIWLNHFEYHAQHPRRIAEDLSDILTASERTRIARSIATFQLGEQSEGRTLLRAAKHFAERHGISTLGRIVELLIREEQRHAAVLQRFMVDHGIALRHTDWTDRVFRRVRRLAGLELYLNVLISAELIGNVYYRALEAATMCQRLRVLCRTLVSDELAHVGFESELLLALRARRGFLARKLTRSAHRIFFAGAATVVWLTHRTVLRHAGFSRVAFMRACFAQYAFYLESAVVALAPSL